MTDERPIVERLFSLEGRVALITGASGGIGRVLAVAFAEAGAAVALSGTNQEKLEETAQQVAAVGGRHAVLPADLSDLSACTALPGRVHDALGGLDILVNNAGTNRRKPLTEFTPDDYETIMAVNLRAPFFLSQAAHPLLCARGGGKIINIGSMTSFFGLGNVGIYGMTKSALAQLTQTMAVEWARDNIQVNCLAPGFIRTPLTERGLWADDHIHRFLLDRIAARRPGLPEDLIGLALLLASPASAYLTGQLIAIDGGVTAGMSWTRDDAP